MCLIFRSALPERVEKSSIPLEQNIKCKGAHFPIPEETLPRSERKLEYGLRRSKRLSSLTAITQTPTISNLPLDYTAISPRTLCSTAMHGNPMIMQLVIDDNDIRTRTLESFQWLQNTYQRDFID